MADRSAPYTYTKTVAGVAKRGLCQRCGSPKRGSGVGYCPKASKGTCSVYRVLAVSVNGKELNEPRDEPMAQVTSNGADGSAVRLQDAIDSLFMQEPKVTMSDRVSAYWAQSWDGSDP